VAPALLGLEDAGRYLGGISARVVRDYIRDGRLTPVPLPGRRGISSRVLLLREDLDALVARWRRRA